MMAVMPDRITYDEFGLFHENASEYGLALTEPPNVRRENVTLPDSRHVSALVWGSTEPELVFVHGTAQNAHTWDTVALALRPHALVAVDLPGHGRSSWRADARYDPRSLADDIAAAIAVLAPNAKAVVGMSLGGLTSIALAVRHPELVRKLVIVDITPGTNREKAKAIVDFVNGPQSFPSFADILARTVEHNPTRSESSLRRGILHNAHQLADGSWEWRYDRAGRVGAKDEETMPRVDNIDYWNDVSALSMPVLLTRGGASPVVDDDDIAEFLRRQPNAQVVVVDGAGHSIQGDRPLELAALITTFAF
jgi:pimeloyl-ACP methyl ester carboxylesterase